jgi:hypothetical protein
MGCHNEHLSTLTFLTEHSWSLLRSVDLKGGGKGSSLRTNNGMFNYIIICPEPSDFVFVWCRRTYNGFQKITKLLVRFSHCFRVYWDSQEV